MPQVALLRFVKQAAADIGLHISGWGILLRPTRKLCFPKAINLLVQVEQQVGSV